MKFTGHSRFSSSKFSKNSKYELFVFPTNGEEYIATVKSKPYLSHHLLVCNNLVDVVHQCDEIYRCYRGVEKIRKEKKHIPRKNRTPDKEEANIILSDGSVYLNGEEVSVNLYEGKCIDPNNDDVNYTFRGLAKLRKGYNRITNEVIFHTKENKSLFVTFSSGNRYGINEIRKVLQAFQKWVKRNFVLEYCVTVLEPNDEGSWHFHCLITFKDEIPDKFSADFENWSSKYNSKKCENQTDVQPLKTKEDIIRVWKYLDPTSLKKRKRAIYYPSNFKNISVFGNRETPTPMELEGQPLEELFGKVGAEDVKEFNKRYIISDEETGEVIFEIATMWFRFNKSKLEQLMGDVAMDEIMKGVYDDTPARGSRGLPLTQYALGAPKVSLSSNLGWNTRKRSERRRYDNEQSEFTHRREVQRSAQLTAVW